MQSGCPDKFYGGTRTYPGFFLGGTGGDHHFNLVVEMGKRLDKIKSKNNENQII